MLLFNSPRTAYDLDVLISRQPRSTTSMYQATPARTPAANELELLDVFDWFNQPRVLHPQDSDPNGNDGVGTFRVPDFLGGNGEFNITNYMAANPEADWLFKATT